MTEEEIGDERWNIGFDVSKSMRYHAYRRSFWEVTDYWTKVITVISGTAVLVTMLGKYPRLEMAFAFLVAIASAADVVLGFSERAKVHDSLYRHFCTLARDIVSNLQPTESDIAKWRGRRLEIEMDEPGTLDWLERRCSAEESKARGVTPRPAWILPLWKIYFSQLAFWPSITRVEG